MRKAADICKTFSKINEIEYSSQPIERFGLTPASLKMKFSIGLRILSMRLGARAKTRVTYGAKRRPIAITKARIRIMTDVCMASINLI